MLLSVIMKKPEGRDRGGGHMATTCGICVFGNDQTPLAGNVRRLRTTRAWQERHLSKPRFALPWHSRRHRIVRLVKPEIIQKCRTLAAGAGIPPWAEWHPTVTTIRTTSTRRQQRQSIINCLWRLPNFRWLSANRLSKLRPSTNPIPPCAWVRKLVPISVKNL